jgi:hypothetical protein
MSKIAVTIHFTEAEFKRMIKDDGMEITDKEKFSKIFNSAKFAKNLAADMKDVWIQANEDMDDVEMLYAGMGLGDVVKDPEFND